MVMAAAMADSYVDRSASPESLVSRRIDSWGSFRIEI
jgi:hypothetical protein